MTREERLVRLVHVRTGVILAERLEAAERLFARMLGLLGRSGLPAGGGMLIRDCRSIHTFFMRFPIDVIFADSEWVVRKTERNLGPWRTACALRASHTVELPAGALDRAAVGAGDALRVEELP